MHETLEGQVHRLTHELDIVSFTCRSIQSCCFPNVLFDLSHWCYQLQYSGSWKSLHPGLPINRVHVILPMAIMISIEQGFWIRHRMDRWDESSL